MSATTERLLELLPVHLRTRDEAAGGTLRAMLDAVAGELDVVETDLDDLYASWFVETCPEWVVPYLADLVGVTDLPPDLGAGAAAGAGSAVSRRAVVANTIAYRRRKGTAAVIEQVARDVTGWPSRAVEYHRLLATSTHVNHVHLDRPATASLRSADGLDLVPPLVARGALDATAHTAEVRRIESGRGRYGVPNVGVFCFPHQVYGFAEVASAADWPEAVAGPDGWSVHPLGRPTPLFAEPTTEDSVERLAGEPDLPVPLRPRRLLALLLAARTDPAAVDDVPVGVRVDGDVLPPSRVRVCGLEDLSAEGGWQVMVDAVSGRLHSYLDGSPATPADVRVRHAYGSLADVGAGTYDRSDLHERVLAEQGYVGDEASDRPEVRAQEAVLADGADPVTIAAALVRAEAAWAQPTDSPVGGTYVVSVGDSSRYSGDATVHVPAATRLVVVAATWRDRLLSRGEVLPRVPGSYAPEGLRPVLEGDLVVSGDPGSAIVVDGLVVTGDVVVQPGDLGWLTLSQCTVGGRVRVLGAGDDGNENCQVACVRSQVTGLDLAPTVPEVSVEDSVVATPGPVSASAVAGESAHLRVLGSTLRGNVDVRTLDASSAVLDGTVTVEHRQVGCVRYSFVGPGSRVPRRFRCVPETDGADSSVPVYVSAEPGSPSYLGLADGCPASIAAGGEGESEMGVHHHLRRPLRLGAARRLLATYVPVGLEIGLFRS